MRRTVAVETTGRSVRKRGSAAVPQGQCLENTTILHKYICRDPGGAHPKMVKTTTWAAPQAMLLEEISVIITSCDTQKVNLAPSLENVFTLKYVH